MIKIINLLLILDMLILITGMVFFSVRPFEVDITIGLFLITVGFVISIILFLLKLRCTMNSTTK